MGVSSNTNRRRIRKLKFIVGNWKRGSWESVQKTIADELGSLKKSAFAKKSTYSKMKCLLLRQKMAAYEKIDKC